VLPAAGPDRNLHERLLKLRRKTYAHTDPEGGRKGFITVGPDNIFGVGEEWVLLPASELPRIADLCDRQAMRFEQEIVAQTTQKP